MFETLKQEMRESPYSTAAAMIVFGGLWFALLMMVPEFVITAVLIGCVLSLFATLDK